MTKQEATRLKVEMSKTRTIQVTGLRKEGRSYAVEAVDRQTGYPFVVYRPEDWAERNR